MAVITIVAARIIFRRTAKPSDDPDLNQRGRRHVGEHYLLVNATENGRGKVAVGDSVWSVELTPGSNDLPQGASVRVVDVSGATLIVEPANSAGS